MLDAYRYHPTRIKALLRCRFLALLIAALIDRDGQNNMTSAALDTILLLGRPPSAYTQPTKSTKQVDKEAWNATIYFFFIKYIE